MSVEDVGTKARENVFTHRQVILGFGLAVPIASAAARMSFGVPPAVALERAFSVGLVNLLVFYAYFGITRRLLVLPNFFILSVVTQSTGGMSTKLEGVVVSLAHALFTSLLVLPILVWTERWQRRKAAARPTSPPLDEL